MAFCSVKQINIKFFLQDVNLLFVIATFNMKNKFYFPIFTQR